jgi:hypothetical protein
VTIGPRAVVLKSDSVVLTTSACPPPPPAPAPATRVSIETPPEQRIVVPPPRAGVGGIGAFVWRTADPGYAGSVRDALDGFNAAQWGFGAPGGSRTDDAQIAGIAVMIRAANVALVRVSWEPMNFLYDWSSSDGTFIREVEGKGSGTYLTLGACIGSTESYTTSLDASLGVVDYRGTMSGHDASGQVEWSNAFACYGPALVLGGTFLKHAGPLTFCGTLGYRFCNVTQKATDEGALFTYDFGGPMLRIGAGLWAFAR